MQPINLRTEGQNDVSPPLVSSPSSSSAPQKSRQRSRSRSRDPSRRSYKTAGSSGAQRPPLVVEPGPSIEAAVGPDGKPQHQSTHQRAPRWFIGPVPVSVAAPQIKKTRKVLVDFRPLSLANRRPSLRRPRNRVRDRQDPERAGSSAIEREAATTIALANGRELENAENDHEPEGDHGAIVEALATSAQRLRRRKKKRRINHTSSDPDASKSVASAQPKRPKHKSLHSPALGTASLAGSRPSSSSSSSSSSSESDDDPWEEEGSSSGDDRKQRLREELIRRVKSNPWVDAVAGFTKRKGKRNAIGVSTTTWVGDSFQIGTDILGSNALKHSPPTDATSSQGKGRARASSSSRFGVSLRSASSNDGQSHASATNTTTAAVTARDGSSRLRLRPPLITRDSARTGNTSFVTAADTASQLPTPGRDSLGLDSDLLARHSSSSDPVPSVTSEPATQRPSPPRAQTEYGAHTLHVPTSIDQLPPPPPSTSHGGESEEDRRSITPARSDTHLIPFPSAEINANGRHRLQSGSGLDRDDDGEPSPEPATDIQSTSRSGISKIKNTGAGLRSALRRAMPSTSASNELGDEDIPSPIPAGDAIRRVKRSVAFAQTASDGDLARRELVRSANHNSVRQGIEDAFEPGDPVPPSEVLARGDSSGELGNTSAGAAIDVQRTISEQKRGGMIDRVLVEVLESRSGSIPSPFDENARRRQVDIIVRDLGEYILNWKHRNIEIWEDFSLPGKEYIVGHKHLAYVVPLIWPSTRLSVYSFTDMSFCLTCPSDSRGLRAYAKKRLLGPDLGSRLFVFKFKARSRAIDWIWSLWRDLEGELPPSIDVHVPVLSTRVTFELPKSDVQDPEAYARLTKEYIIDACRDALADLPSYKALVYAGPLATHRLELALAWSHGSMLDWIWLDTDVEDTPRDWGVLFGLAMRQAHENVQLELRVARHSITRAKISDGSYIQEPPPIEGYLHRIKNKTQARVGVYISSHLGNLFTMTTAKAFPPPIPRPPEDIITAGSSSENPDLRKSASQISAALDADYTYEAEQRRGASQVLHASGCIDMRDISSIRRCQLNPASQREPRRRGLLSSQTAPLANITGAEDLPLPPGDSDSEIDEPGGEDHLAAHKNKIKLREKRSIEVVMRSGRVIKLEAHSIANALEWVRRLRALVEYWTVRHRVDARAEMDLQQTSHGKQRVQIPSKLDMRWNRTAAPSEIADPQVIAEQVGTFWTWCVLDGCLPMLKAGRVFKRNQSRFKAFKNFYMALLPGHLVLYHIVGSPSGYHHHSKTINLSDSIVYSGALAADQFPELFDYRTAPRRYQDGLETDDAELSTTFVLRYRKHPAGWKEGVQELSPLHHKKLPKTHTKDKILIIKARSQLERDAWCWAISVELERVVRYNSERESKLRGGV